MFQKAGSIDIPESNPFENDKLKRAPIAEYLTRLSRGLSEPFVLCIDAPWGAGKTTFVDMWKKQLEIEEFECLSFNAWETDYVEDPLTAFLGELKKQINELKTVDDGEVKKHLKTALTYGAKFAKTAGPAALKALTYGMLDLSKQTEQSIAETFSKVSIDAIESYEEQRESLRCFKENFERFTSELRPDPDSPPVVLFIDEIDRCRPDYAVLLLERIKHVFSVKGVFFVISANIKQLRYSIKAVYGEGLDANGYLRRFIDLIYRLPDPEYDDYCGLLYERFALSLHCEDRIFVPKKEDVCGCIARISTMFGLSPRDIEQVFIRLKVVLATLETEFWPAVELYALMAILYQHRPELFDQVNATYNFDKFLGQLPKTFRTFRFSKEGYRLYSYMLACLIPGNQNDRQIREVEGVVGQQNQGSQIFVHAQNCLHFYRNLPSGKELDDYSKVIQRVKFGASFRQ